MDAKQIKQIRTKLKLSQSGFAQLLSISVRTIQDWEQGRHKPYPSAATLLRLAESGALTKRAKK